MPADPPEAPGVSEPLQPPEPSKPSQPSGSVTSNQDGEAFAIESRRRTEIYHIALLLRQLTLPELVPRILDVAELWASDVINFGYSEERERCEALQTDNDAYGRALLVSGPLSWALSRRIRRVTFHGLTLHHRMDPPLDSTWHPWFAAHIARQPDHQGRLGSYLDQDGGAFGDRCCHDLTWEFGPRHGCEESSTLECARPAGLNEGDYLVLSAHSLLPAWDGLVMFAAIKILYSLVL